MGITLVIVGGIVIISVAASVFGYLGSRKSGPDMALEERVRVLEARLGPLVEAAREKDELVGKLDNDVLFLSRLVEGRTK